MPAFRAVTSAAVFVVSLFLPFANVEAQTALPGLDGSGAVSGSAATAESPLTRDEVERVLQLLEDPDRRAEIVGTLRALAQVSGEAAPQEAGPSVKTAATELIDMLAEQLGQVSGRAGALVEMVDTIPALVAEMQADLADERTRERWLTVAWRLAAVLGAGFVAAWVVGLIPLTLRRRTARDEELTLPTQLLRLAGFLIVDLLPIVAFAAAAYGVLTLVDPQRETRLVAIALINASLLSRLVLLVARALLAPRTPTLRLWKLDNATAKSAYRWARRMSVTAIYGYAALQAGLLLGLDEPAYTGLLHLLGLVVLLMLLVLITQNRKRVAQAIAPEPEVAAAGIEAAAGPEAVASAAAHPESSAEVAPGIEDTLRLSSLRKGLARVWHLLAGLYLVVIYAIWVLQIRNGALYLLQATLITLAVLAAWRLLSHALDRFFSDGISLSPAFNRRHPGLEQRLNRYYPVLHRFARVLLFFVAVLGIAAAWGLGTLQWALDGSGRDLFLSLLNILLILVAALFVWEFASGGIERYLSGSDEQGVTRARSARIRTLLTVARNALLVLLTIVAVLMVLSELGLNIAPLLAGAGVVGLAIGFGAQRLVQDVINGAFILFQDLMSVGDVVKVGDKGGLVEALSIRTVRLRDLSGVVHTIPFSSIDSVSNLTRHYAYHVFELGIAYREDVDEVIDLIKRIGEELQADPETGPMVLEPIEMFGLDAFGDSAIVIKGRIKTQPLKQWAVMRAFNRLVKLRFDEHGIEIPFPHRTLYFGEDKQGRAPAAAVRVESMLMQDAAGPAAVQLE
jgi:small-conductance mechanosensitive channel